MWVPPFYKSLWFDGAFGVRVVNGVSIRIQNQEATVLKQSGFGGV